MSFRELYVGATGMKTMGDSMSVIGNNIANVNTVGYKSSNAVFQNLISQSQGGYASTSTGFSQVGLGSSIATIMGNFTNGAVMSASSSTDLAISGKGFFQVLDPDNGALYYTRAGNFTFDSKAVLRDPSGCSLQGYAINSDGTRDTTLSSVHLNITQELRNGVLTDVVVMDPKATTNLTGISNLNSSMTDNAQDDSDPFFAMAKSWNGQEDPALSSSSYSYSSTVKSYDSDGNVHNLTVYYDKVTTSNAGGASYYEYIVTCDPADDYRTGALGTSNAGLLGMGTLSFSDAGVVQNQTLFSFSGTSTDPNKLGDWIPAEFSEDGSPVITANFGTTTGDTQTISLNLSGLTSATDSWNNAPASAAAVGTGLGNLPNLDSRVYGSTSSTAYAAESRTSSTQDGYTKGYLQDVAFSSEGVMSGEFSNGQTQELYQLTLFNFTNEQGLYREGNNHYTATPASGTAKGGLPGEGPNGTITGGALEASNVDLANQFVNLITTQRGYQANSKVVSTGDALLQTLIGMKR